jgi:hypothetical protein
MEYASSRGELLNHLIAGLSKHDIGKVAWNLIEFPPATLRVMPGFLGQDEYYVPRTQIEPPLGMSRDDVTCMIFLLQDKFGEQRETPTGDHGPEAHTILYCVLPNLAMVVVRDGIYWIHDYPDHKASSLILHIMPPGYTRWAVNAHNDSAHHTNERDVSRVTALNLAAQSGLDHVCHQVALLNRNIDPQRAEIVGHFITAINLHQQAMLA